MSPRRRSSSSICWVSVTGSAMRRLRRRRARWSNLIDCSPMTSCRCRSWSGASIGGCRSISSCSMGRTTCARWRSRLRCRPIPPISSTSLTAASSWLWMGRWWRMYGFPKRRITISRTCPTARLIMRSLPSALSSRSSATANTGAPRRSVNSAISTRMRGRWSCRAISPWPRR